MLHRIFLALHLPQHVKEKITKIQENIPELPVKWTTPKQMHITLVFIGNASNKEVEAIKIVSQQVAKRHKGFSFQFTEVSYGPNVKEPRMIWLNGNPPKEFMNISKDLEKSLSASKEIAFTPEKRPFALHLTLGRLNEFEFRVLDLEERPDIHQEVSIEIPVQSFEIIESELTKTGPEYTTIQSFALKD